MKHSDKQSLFGALNRMESELVTVMDRLSEFDESQLNAKPGPDIWSPLEVFNHMYLSEKLSLHYVKKKLSFDPSLGKAGLGSRVRSSALNLFLRTPFKFSAPVKTRGDASLSALRLVELENQWKEHRHDLKQFLETVDAKWLDKEVFKHPIAGRISIEQMMEFFQGHFERHRKQMMARLPS